MALANSDVEFMQYIALWNKSYATRDEYSLRKGRWEEADAFIKHVNESPEYTHSAAHNYLSDSTHEEKSRIMPNNVQNLQSESPLKSSQYTSIDYSNGNHCV